MSLLLFNHFFKKRDLIIPFENLTLWLDGADANTITNTLGAISQWDDKSNNRNHVIQEIGAYQPTTGITKLNNLNTVKFNTSNYLSSIKPVTTDDNVTAFIVLNNILKSAVSTRNVDFFRVDGTGGYAGSGGVTFIRTASEDSYAMYNGINLISNFKVTNDTALLTSVFNGINSKLIRNKEEIASGDTGTLSTTGTLDISDVWVDGEIAEFIMYNRILSEEEINRVENYLINKWLPHVIITSTPGITLWLDSSDASTITEIDNSIAQIDDKSGNNNHATQSIASLQPIFGSDAKGNYIQFAASGLGTSQNFLEATNPINAKTVFFVCDHAGNTFSGVLGGNQTSSSHIFLQQSGYAISVDGSVSDIGSWYLDGVFQATGGNIGDPTIIGNNTRLHTVKYNAGDPATTFELISAFNSTKIGGFGGKIREIITYDEYLSDADRTQVESYLLNKWSL